MLEKEDIDVVIIVIESGYYVEIVIYFMNKGVSVFVEKLMVMFIDDVNEMIKVVKENNVKFGVCY